MAATTTNDMTPFAYDGHQVRVITRDGEPWFVARDVCDVLAITNAGNVLAALDEDERSSIHIADGTSGNPNRAIVSEAGLYSLILRSRKPEAKMFKRWVTHEVLPSIRPAHHRSRPGGPHRRVAHRPIHQRHHRGGQMSERKEKRS